MTHGCKPRFLDGPSGRLFSLHFSPVGKGLDQVVIHVPAFSEEMNKARRMVALQARSLATLGYHVLLFDLFGTGDSEGDFSDASWEAWLQDLAFLWHWAEENDFGSVSLWGLRMGCLLGSDFLVRYNKKAPFLLFWQPSVSGKTLLNQFLRLRIASAMIGDGPKESTKSLIESLEKRDHVEVAGYNLGPDLALPMMQSRLESLSAANFDALFWLELSNLPNAALLPASLRTLKHLEAQNPAVTPKALKGTAFWSTQEITEAQTLISETETLLC